MSATPPITLNSRKERRGNPRQRVLLGAILIHGPAALTMDCTVRDYTSAGARVRIGTPGDFSNPMMLLICQPGEAYEAHVTWRRANELGLAFQRQADLNNPVTALEKTARRLWTERRAR